MGGVFDKYARLVSSASKGAITIEPITIEYSSSTTTDQQGK